MGYQDMLIKEKQINEIYEHYLKMEECDYIRLNIMDRPKNIVDLRKQYDPLLNLLIYFPDYAVKGINKKFRFKDTKGGSSIEKSAYDTYKRWAFGYGGLDIITIYDGCLIEIPIDNLKLKKPQINDCPFDDIWASPRLLTQNEYYEWLKQHPRASGTAFAYIDFKKSKIITLKVLDRVNTNNTNNTLAGG